MSTIKGLLFDLDGVIVDTAKYHYLTWKNLAEKLEINFTKEDNERLKGVSRLRSLEIILEIGGIELSAEEKERLCTQKNDIYLNYVKALREEEMLPGVKEFLKEARKKGYKISLGSASKNSMLILERLNITQLFDAVIDGTKVSKAKPDPEVFVKGAEALGLACGECIVFEDASAGIEAAHNAGMLSVGVGTLEALPEADTHISGFDGLSVDDILEKLSCKLEGQECR